jgi:peptide/nickel transport system permease protein
VLMETQYARWAERVFFLGSGTEDDGASTLRKLRDRAKPTLAIVVCGVALAYGLALVLGAIGAMRSRAPVDRAVVALTLAAYVVPTACIATVLAHGVGPPLRMLGAIAALACAMVAAPLVQVRLGLSQALARGHVRLAVACGAGPRRAVFRSALRNAALPVVALGSVEMPAALGGSFVVEKAFGIAGLGAETIRAVQTHDVSWLVGLAFATALLLALTSIASDLIIAAIDPRLSLAVLRHRRAAE